MHWEQSRAIGISQIKLSQKIPKLVYPIPSCMSLTLNDDIIRTEVAEFLHLMPSRNRQLIRERSVPLLNFLATRSDRDYPAMAAMVTGFVTFIETNFNEAVEIFERGIEKGRGYPSLVGAMHIGLGICWRSLGDNDQAVTQFYRALDLIDNKSQFRKFVVYAYHLLGEIFIAIEEYDKAIEYFHKEFDMVGVAPEGVSLFRVSNGLGVCYQKMKQYDLAKEHLTKALNAGDLSREVFARAKNDLGMLHLELKEYADAEELLIASLKTREELALEDAASTTMMGLGEVYLAQGRTQEAVDLLCRCKAITDKFKTKQKQVKAIHLLARALSANGDYQSATHHYEQFNSMFKETRSEQEKKIFKLMNEQIERQRKMIADKHDQLMATFEEVKRLKINRKSIYFSWLTVILLVLVSEVFLDPLIEHLAYDNLLSLAVKVLIACLFKPIDGIYEGILWNRTIKKVV
jgi:tetratricopeptide (TPR) repeat protein